MCKTVSLVLAFLLVKVMVMIGISVLKVEQLNDGEYMLDLDVDGIDASDILSAI